MEHVKQKKISGLLAVIASLIMAILVLGIALGALKPINPYIAYHQWQMDRTAKHFFAHPDDNASIKRIEYHRDRLVSAGAYELFKYTFSNVDSSSPEARRIVKAIISRQSPPHEEFVSPAPQKSRPLEISILCTPENLGAWKKFVAANDAP